MMTVPSAFPSGVGLFHAMGSICLKNRDAYIEKQEVIAQSHTGYENIFSRLLVYGSMRLAFCPTC